jgi:hypothetical protein
MGLTQSLRKAGGRRFGQLGAAEAEAGQQEGSQRFTEGAQKAGHPHNRAHGARTKGRESGQQPQLQSAEQFRRRANEADTSAVKSAGIGSTDRFRTGRGG